MNEKTYSQNSLLSKYLLTGGPVTSDGFLLLEIILHSTIPKLRRTYIEPERLIDSLVVKNRETLFEFYSRAKVIREELKHKLSVYGLNRLLNNTYINFQGIRMLKNM